MNSEWSQTTPADSSRPGRIRHLLGAILVLAVISLSGCSNGKVEPLMETPLIFQLSEKGPLDHIPEEQQWNLRKVYYVTTRERAPDRRQIVYSNREAEEVSIGMALITFGGYSLTWSDLVHASVSADRPEAIPLYISGIMEAGRLQVSANGELLEVRGAGDWLLREMRESIRAARDKDVLIYVHGAKVDFYNACVFAAQLDHFMGRDMTSVAFSWPTRQNIAAYVIGNDVARGRRSAPALASLIRVIADNSEARRIHIVSWSAGGRVVTDALSHLHDLFPDDSPEAHRERFRLGRIYYAAADVPRDAFIEALPKINSLVQEVIVTASSEDEALKSAVLFMGGSKRIGQAEQDPLTPEQRTIVDSADRLQFVDVSSGREDRGFDITGHRYWLDHPWASTDMLLTIRSDLDPEERGLVQGYYKPFHWIMPPDYEERIKGILDEPTLQLRKTSGPSGEETGESGK